MAIWSALVCCSLLIKGCFSLNLDNRTKSTSSSALEQINCNCPTDIRPVCATDGVISYTYVNLCILQCNQNSQPDLRLDYDGFCCDESTCSSEADAICDSSGQLHLNLCYFEYAQCVEKQKYGRNLTVNNQQQQTCVCNKPCADVDNPVCDTLGNIHKNPCHFRNAKCYAKLKYNITIDINYYGTCCDSHCQRINQTYFPICATNGKSYKNFCDYYTAQCVAFKKYNRIVRITKIGAC